MNKTAYNKTNILRIKFPSGLELDIKLPTAKQFLFNIKLTQDNKSDTEVLKEIMAMLEFPEGWSFADLNLGDGLYLTKVINDLFTKATQSQNGS